jgi:uncharacterized protein YbcC (UPF0753/DUF2309 family)
MINQNIKSSIEEASEFVGSTWPLYSFVTSNPLSGYEKFPFEKAVNLAEHFLDANMYPQPSMFEQALNNGEIDEYILLQMLEEHQLLTSPEESLKRMKSQISKVSKHSNSDLDRIMAKWLSLFMDEGLADWEMPFKKEGFYAAWRKLVGFDNEIGHINSDEIPHTSHEAIAYILDEYPIEVYTKICKYHIGALPGWTGYIKYRNETNSIWQQKYPISLEDYLGVRLWVAKLIDAEILPKKENKIENTPKNNLPYIWLKAWEKSCQTQLISDLNLEVPENSVLKNELNESPKAQMVFCIDTRSELIRRHIESKGDYETFGYAGFFGIAMDYTNLHNGLSRKSCPPIVPSSYNVSEVVQEGQSEKLNAYHKKSAVKKFKKYFLKRMKNMLPSTFGFVEGSGLLYGLKLIARTLTPKWSDGFILAKETRFEEFCEPQIKTTDQNTTNNLDIPLVEKVKIVKTAFDFMGWKNFAPIVAFVGHGSHTSNNPFASSLDCGACAASPGRHNARMLAKLANLQEVRKSLKSDYDISIPSDTIFMGAEHNTTTDEILFFDSEVPKSHTEMLQKIKTDLRLAQETATQERLGVIKNSVSVAQSRAADWSETRPEWGLAKNAGFVIGSRELTKNKNLQGRCFLHSYDWSSDKKGEILEGIMQGPMVVTQWINNHYYFSTVDNDTFGGGSKITHNITGKFGVVNGNGGDLKMGLPLQSIRTSDQEMYHQPLRLSVLIHAPITIVSEILVKNDTLKNLLDNEWIYLTVIDPIRKNMISHYHKNLNWKSSENNNNESREKKMSQQKTFKQILVE